MQGKVFSDQELDFLEESKKQKLIAKRLQENLNLRQNQIKRLSKVKVDSLQHAALVEVQLEMKKDSSFKFSSQQRKDYKTLGGTPHLDGEYTVFGEVTEGLEIVSQISKLKTGRYDRPAVDVRVLKALVIK